MPGQVVSGLDCENRHDRENGPSFAVSEDFERAAAQGLPMPENLNSAQQRLYLALRGVYRDYRAGATTRLQATSEKAQAVREYMRDPVCTFVRAVRDTEEARRQYHLQEAAGASAEELLKLAKRIIRDATGDGTF